MNAEEKKRTGELLDAHIKGAFLNPGAWMKPRTGKRRLARGQIAPSRIERVQLDVLGQLEEAPGPTLYIAPARRRPINAAMAERLGLRLS